MTINCAIVDDESLARTLIEEHVSKIPYLKVVASVKSPLMLNQALDREPIDLLFIDIQMPDIKGTNFIKTMQNQPLVVFTTAYPEYALEGFELDAIDYLVKPISFERFLQAVSKAEKFLNKTTQTNIYTEQMTESNDFITVKADHKLYKIKHQDILYIEGLKEYVSFFTRDGKRIIALESLKSLENKLPEFFMRVHKSYIINMNEMETVEGNTVLVHGKDIPVGGSYKDALIRALFN